MNAELVSAPGGDVWWSHVLEAAPDAVLDVHDELARRVQDALPLSARDRRTPRARAGNDAAFDTYLRGMQLRTDAAGDTASTPPLSGNRSVPG